MNLLRAITLGLMIGALTACGVNPPDKKDQQSAEVLAQEVANAAKTATASEETVEEIAAQTSVFAEDAEKKLCDKFLASNAAQKIKDTLLNSPFDKVDTRVVVMADNDTYILMVFPLVGGVELGQSFNYRTDVNMTDVESLAGFESTKSSNSAKCILPLK
jgi:hypothetical protein